MLKLRNIHIHHRILMNAANAILVAVINREITRRLAAKLGVEGFVTGGKAEETTLCILDGG